MILNLNGMKKSLQQKPVTHCTKYRLLFLSVFFFSLVSVNTLASDPFSGGDGSASNPWQITTLAQLDSVHNYPDSAFILMNDLDFSGSVYDKTNSYYGWKPIGSSFSTSFTGSFNGAGHTISNLYIRNTRVRYLGLFGIVSGASIDSLGLIDVTVIGGGEAGGLVGTSRSSSTITSCYSTGSISGDVFIGGLVGNNSDGSTITNCYSKGSVSGTSYTGGLVGQNSSSSVITDSYSTCSVSGTGSYTGGLVGYNYKSTVIRCASAGSITGAGDTGGLIGDNTNSSTITDCYSTGSVSGSVCVGGLVGNNYSGSPITGCYSSGNVSGTSYTGGLVGKNVSSPIKYTYFNNETSEQTAGIGSDDGFNTVTGLTTVQMKQQSSLTGFDFTDVWVITNGKTFPRLDTIYNVPVILNNISTKAKVSVLYTDTVHVVPMDNDVISLALKNEPDGMQMQDSIITWTPDSIGVYTFSIKATDANQGVSEYSVSIAVLANGEGTKENPYQITTIDELNLVRYVPDAYYVLMNDLDFSGSIYDNAHSTEGWIPICDKGSNFTGNFNGAGHTIKNMIINRASGDYVGLFGNTDGASVDSLGVVNCSVQGRYYVGSLVGNSISSSIANCYATGSVTGSYNTGGLIGYNSSSDITNSYSRCSVAGSRVGGLVGYNSSSAITGCYSAGNVTGSSSAGGLVGYNTSSAITYSYYNTETSNQSSGIGTDDNSQTVTGLTIAQMKQQSNFLGFDFTGIWAIREDSTYPALRSLDNVPFAFSDTISASADGLNISQLLTNDFDYETQQANLIVSVETLSAGYITSGKIFFDNGASNNDTIKVTYQAGEVRNTANDTLWGNTATSCIILKNNVPAFTSLTVSTPEDSFVSMLLATDADDDSISYTILTSAIKGVALIRNDSLIYNPVINFNGNDSLQIIISDRLFSDTSWVKITVTPVNDAPVLKAVNDLSTLEDTPVILSMNDVTATDVDGDILELVIYNGANYTVSGTTVTPEANYNGTLTVPISVTDGVDTSNVMNIIITVTPVNDAPVLTAVSDLSTLEDTPVILSMDDVTASDIDGDALSLVVSEGANYTVSGTTITPTANYIGTLTVPVSVTDGIDATTTMNMIVTVTSVNDTPVLTAVSNQFTLEDTPITLSMDDVTSTDADGDALSLIIYNGSNYTLSGLTVKPAVDYNGTLTVPVSVTDGIDTSNVMNISITVTAVNDTPEVTAVSSLSTLEDTPVTLSLDDVMATDADGDVLLLIVSDGANYMLSGNTITPAADYNGILTVPVSVTDGIDTSNVMNISITVTAVNDAPEVTAVSSLSTLEDTPVTLSLDDVTATDIDGDVLLLIVSDGANYTLSGNMITPAADYNGILTVPVSVTDGTVASNVMNIIITVDPVNDAPVLSAVNDLSTLKDTPITLSIDDVSASDIDGDALSLVISAGSDYTLFGTTITPDAGFTGTLTVPLAVTDGSDTSGVMDLHISVEEVNGIGEVSAGNIRIFPNPVRTILNIKSESIVQKVEVINLSGKRMLWKDYYSTAVTVDVQQLQTGIYLLKVQTMSGTMIQRLIKE